MKPKYIIIIQTVVIIILIIFVIIPLNSKKQEQYNGLLSTRIYAQILEPESYLIFNFDPLKIDLLETINNSNVSIYVRNLRDGADLGINEDQGYYPASLNKMLAAIVIARKIEKGELSFDTIVQLNESDRISTFGQLYKSKEKELPLRVFFEEMLKNSDNTAFYVLLRHYSNDTEVSFVLNYLNYFSFDTYSNQNKPADVGETSADSMANVFTSLYLSTLLQPKDSEYILSLLTKDVFDIKKIANIPDDIRIAHKFGYNYGDKKVFHDCGIMYIDRSRIFYCVMTKDLDKTEALNLIGTTVNKIYKYVKNTRSTLDAYKT